MPRGAKPGERRGGRIKGTPNKTNLVRQARIAAEGITPLNLMLKHMRRAHAESEALDPEILKLRVEIKRAAKPKTEDGKLGLATKVLLLAEMRADQRRLRSEARSAASDAAPYSHNKLASIEQRTPPGQPLEHRVYHDLSDASIKKIMALVGE